MPGCARRVRPAYSRTLCLPCLKAGFFCFYTTATDLFMSSFLFLHFCDDVFELLGLYFSAFTLSRVSSGGFLPLPSKPPQGSHTASTGLVCGFAGVVPYPASKTAHKAAQGRVWFLPRTNLPLPLKGEGLGIILVGFVGVFTQRSPVLFRRKRRILRIRGLLSAVATGNCWSQTAHTASTGPVWGFPGVVSLPCPQNRTQGRTGASLVLARWLALVRRIVLPFGNPV